MGRRAVEAVVGLFALLGFAFVPLGSKTGLEHTVALASTPTAREAVSGLAVTLDRAREQVMRALVRTDVDSAPLPLPSAAGRNAVRASPPVLPDSDTRRAR